MNMLRDKEGLPRVLFHFSRTEIPNFEFKPLTHFGTCQAAHERWCGTGSSNPDTRVYPVLLKMKNPIRVTDSGDLGIRIDPRELIKAGLSRADTHFIFQPFIPAPMTKASFDAQADKNHCYGELQFYPQGNEKIAYRALKQIFSKLGCPTETLFPLYDRDVQSELDRVWTDKPRIDLVTQRLKTTLLDNGFDGIVYENREEDYGQDSFCILSPDQVVSYFDYNFGPNRPRIKAPQEGYRYQPSDKVFDPKDWDFSNYL
jgi:hypothetical protein